MLQWNRWNKLIWPIDIRFVQTDAPSYAFQTVSSVFTSAEEEMKRIKLRAKTDMRHLHHWLYCHRLVASWLLSYTPSCVLGKRLTDRWRKYNLVWVRARCIRKARRRWETYCDGFLGYKDGTERWINCHWWMFLGLPYQKHVLLSNELWYQKFIGLIKFTVMSVYFVILTEYHTYHCNNMRALILTYLEINLLNVIFVTSVLH